MSLEIPPISQDEAFSRLSEGATLITVNRRLSRYLAQRYADSRMAGGVTVWETPDMLPYGAWLARMFESLLYQMDDPDEPLLHLLGDPAERLLWERVIGESDAAGRLVNSYETARMAQEARRLCYDWDLPIGGSHYWSAPDPAAFARWASAFERHCSELGCIDRARLAPYVAEKVAEGRLAGAGVLILAGFDELTPRQQQLFAAIGAADGEVYRLADKADVASAIRVAVTDDTAEMRAAARWARKQVESEPHRTVGIIVPQLSANRETVCRIFEDVLQPSDILSPKPPGQRLFNITAGRPLAAYPVIEAAMTILSLAAKGRGGVFEWGRLLRSPFLGGAEAERSSRAFLDLGLREHGDLSFSIGQVIGRAGGVTASTRNHHDLKRLSSCLEKLKQQADRMPVRQSAVKWVNTFSAILEAAGWPGERRLSSEEWQTVSAWRENLERFAQISVVTDALAGEEGLRHLYRQLSETPFQPEQADVPIQVMGMLEAAGERFDALWIMGMHHDAWPPPARSNPFLPVALQRIHGLPHASPDRELAYARQITRRLLASADSVICSFGEYDGESRRLASPLIMDAAETRIEELDLGEAIDYWAQASAESAFERLTDTVGASVASGQAVVGGTGIMKSQAACPFQAYGRYRLGAKALETPEPGLNARDRGSLVHRALELLWEALGDHGTLIAMGDEQVDECIDNAVATAIAEIARNRPGAFTERFTVVETRRLRQLIGEWLERDRERAPFTVIAKERKMEVEIGDIRLWAYVDRIDELDNGGLVIIDYKTGRPSARDWFGERIAEPQLPLYSTAAGTPLAGVLFGQVRKGETAYIGIAASGGLAPGVKGVVDDNKNAKDFDTLEGVIAEWEQRLYAIAGEISSGHAAVTPVSVHKSCRYCDLQPLCRIGELRHITED